MLEIFSGPCSGPLIERRGNLAEVDIRGIIEVIMKTQKPGKTFLLKLYRTLILIRRTQEKIVELYPQGEMKCPTHLYVGEEAIAAGVCAALRPADRIMSYYRNHGHYLARGGDLTKLFAELYGRSGGTSGGRGGSMHLSDPHGGMMGTTAIVGSGIPIGVGLAFAAKYKKENRVVACFFGDGAVEEGAFHESLNFAALHKLPILFVCENNFYAALAPLKERQGRDAIFEHARPYRMPGVRFDGNDVLRVYGAARKAAERARAGKGPTLLECRTYRLRGHIESFLVQTDYRSKGELSKAWRNDPLKRFSRYLSGRGIEPWQLKRIEQAVDKVIAGAVTRAHRSPFPTPETILDHVYPVRGKSSR